MVVLAVVPVSIKTVWLKKKFCFGLTKEFDNNIMTYKYVFPSIPKARLLNIFILTRIILRLYKIVKADWNKPDVIQIHEYQAGVAGYKISKKDKIPYIVTEHCTAFFTSSLSNCQLRAAKLVFNNAAACIAVSKMFCNFLSLHFKREFEYIPNVIAFEDVKIHTLGLNSKKIKICNVAALVKRKNHEMLIRAFEKVSKDIDNIELHIGGDGPEIGKLRKLIESLNLEQRIFLHGELNHSDVMNLINACDLFVLSSNYETFGIVLIEALACGKPIVSTKCGGPESIIVSDKIGILTENNENDLYEGMRQAIDRMQEGFYDSAYLEHYAKNTYSKEVIGRKYLDLYEKVLHEEKVYI
jgi:glycosyltransferase involved in cell wall biosynthesis